MNASDIKWITSYGIELNPFFYSIPEKMDNFGYCVDFSGYGEGKADKAKLCILDTLNKNEKPNILIICPAGFKESWYNSLLSGLGLDFKFVNGAPDSVMYFSAGTSNLLILDESVLAEEGASAYATIRNSGLLWDLLIIDAAGSIDGVNPELYTKNIGMKAKKFLMFAPYASEYTQSPDGIKEIVKEVLSEKSMADGIDAYSIDENVMKFTMETPLVNYPREDSGENSIKVIKYAFDEKELPQNLHIDENASGRYMNGGNIFEEYNLPERKIYQKPSYTRSEAEVLKNKDKKLEKFLELIDPVMNSDDKLAVVYFESEATVKYIEKILYSIYYDRASSIKFLGKSRFDIRQMKQWYETLKSQRTRVILAFDRLSETVAINEPFTHIINYELPDNPVYLQQRYMRRTFARGAKPEFFIFLDENGTFDSRVLGKALAGNLYKAFRRNIASENVLFNIEGIDQILADMIADIKYVAEFTGAVGSSFDIISRFKFEYNIPAARNLTTAAKTHEYSQRKLETIAAALGVSELVRDKDIDKAALLEAISKKTKEIREGFAYFDDSMTIRTIPRLSARTSDFKQFASYLDGNPFNLGLKTAREKLGEAVKGKNDFAYIKDAIINISDALKPAVLYNIWLYWHKELGIGGSYAEFIKAYNEGVI